jgi:hypothetical protein
VCNLSIHLQTLQSIHSSAYIAIYSFILLFDRSKEGFWQIDLSVPTEVVFVRQQRRRRRLAQVASTAAEETGGLERGGNLESFGMKSETTWDGLLFIGLKISATVLN